MKWTDGLSLAPAVARSRFLGGPPFKLLLSLTDRCTHRCSHCRTWTRAPGDELRPDEVARMLDHLPGLRWLDLTGGEIVARPDADALADAIASRSSRLVFLHFATNGWAPQRVLAFADRLRAAPGPRTRPLIVTVSIDGDRALNDRLRGRKGAFDRAVATAEALARLPGVDVYVGTNVTPDNIDALERTHAAIVQALPGLGRDRWHVNLMNRSGHFFGNLDVPTPAPADLRRAVDSIGRLRGTPRDAFAVVERLFLATLRGYLADGDAPVPCQALRASVFVGPTGDVHPCHVHQACLGNLRDADCDVNRILDGAPARRERTRIRQSRCAECWTPCEAYPAMIASPLRTLLAALAPKS